MAAVTPTQRIGPLKPLALAVWLLVCSNAKATDGHEFAAATMQPDTLQLSPGGFSGAINTPTADVLPLGNAGLAVSNSVPEVKRSYPGKGSFGTANVAFGVLPGLELVGRLSYDGDLQCNLYAAKSLCPAGMRDLSVSAKYQLPLLLPYNTRLAVGVTDFGGAATKFRQTYGVVTSSMGPLDMTAGYSKTGSATALMNGFFGNLAVRVNDQLAVVLESDTQAKRLGAHYVQPLTPDLQLQLGLSKKLSGPAHQQSSQFTAALRYALAGNTQKTKAKTKLPTPAPATNDAATPDQRALRLAGRLAANGFANINVTALPASAGQPLLWWIEADPVGWRNDHQKALGVGLAQWLLGAEADETEVVLTLSYMGHPTTSLYSNRACLKDFAEGGGTCTLPLPVRYFQGQMLPQRVQSAQALQAEPLVVGKASAVGKPQFEVGLNLRSSVGTELGLFDYSAALDLGAQVQLGNLGSMGKGWMWQGNVLVPLARSKNYEDREAFSLMGHPKVQLDQALLSHIQTLKTPWAENVALQTSVGAINSYSKGGQVDAVWIAPAGGLRVGGTLGIYNRANGVRTTTPALLSARHSLLPGQWMLEGTVGEFLGGDRGWMLKSQHWYGNVSVSFFVQSSDGKTAANPKRNFAGFEISVPFAGLWQKDYGWASVRGMDRFTWGQKTKVGENDNVITGGYGEVPKPRHGVWTDFTDHDRAGSADAWAQRNRTRDSMAPTE